MRVPECTGTHMLAHTTCIWPLAYSHTPHHSKYDNTTLHSPLPFYHVYHGRSCTNLLSASSCPEWPHKCVREHAPTSRHHTHTLTHSVLTHAHTHKCTSGTRGSSGFLRERRSKCEYERESHQSRGSGCGQFLICFFRQEFQAQAFQPFLTHRISQQGANGKQNLQEAAGHD